jgi:cytochrome c peroxidase
MKKIIYILFIFFVGLVSFQSISPLMQQPKGWPKPQYNFAENKLSQAKINIGRALFYDAILSKDSTISCASCHLSYTAFTHVDHALSHGIGDSIGKRNSPALMNLAWQTSFMWDGAVNNIEVQALAPLHDIKEMGENITHVVEKLNRSPLYQQLFYQAYKDSIINSQRMLKCMAQFMLTLVSANSKYDKVMKQQETFTAQEKNGYIIFKNNCTTCHTEPLFTNTKVANNGLPIDTVLKDFGRMKITNNAADSLLFKVPTLRNIEYSFPYMHDGRFKKLSQVINHYTNGIQASATLSSALKKPIALSANDKVDLIAFLLTLSDKEFVFNPKHQYPKEILIPTKEK